MFGNNGKSYENMSTSELLMQLLADVDEIKRYTANTYNNTDSEVSEIRDTVRKIEMKLSETDRQVDRIERFEREISEMKGILKNMERRIK